MGADSHVFVFDHERYRVEIAPALIELVRTGNVAPWIDDLFRSGELDGEWVGEVRSRLPVQLRRHPADLARFCTWLGDDLRHAGPEPVPSSPRARMRCSSATCPERAGCAFHTSHVREREPGTYYDLEIDEALGDLFEALVATRCLGPSQFVGRTVTPDLYLPVLDDFGLPSDDPARVLLRSLGRRGAVIGYQYEASDGVYGWLTVPETAALAARLDRLDLPRCEPGFEAMHRLLDEQKYSWPQVSLSFVRSMATTAAAGNRAILWGADVMPRSWLRNRTND